ncbi:hypothetical protein FRC03_001579 [Tulasnella sp. 419]|nr:hypothetical protein FRC02_011755 [Tulasnella sp. 418]KAG8964615.1 hypothetical protein FRC03_001579 [Tulasnella sp. 419]
MTADSTARHSRPTILINEPGEDTIARLKQMAPYYWSHPDTTNCAIHFPIDIKQQGRILTHQARQKRNDAPPPSHVTTSSHLTPGRRPSWTPSPSSRHLSRQSSSQRLRSSISHTSLSSANAKASILGSSDPSPPMASGGGGPSGLSSRRGSLTPGYDPFAKTGTSIITPTTPAFSQYASTSFNHRRESAPVHEAVHPPPPAPTPESIAALRRGSAPSLSGPGISKGTPMRTVRLHLEYLTAQSALLRQVFAQVAGFSSLSEAQQAYLASSAQTPPTSVPTTPTKLNADLPAPSSSNPFPHSFFRFSPSRYPRVLNPSPTQIKQGQIGPIIILPVPDPASFPLLIHYMYFGKMDGIEKTLREGHVTWEGLVRNVEYLGLRDDVKKYLGAWWKRWRDSQNLRSSSPPTSTETPNEEDEDDNAYRPQDINMDTDSEVEMHISGIPESTALDDEMAGLLDRF